MRRWVRHGLLAFIAVSVCAGCAIPLQVDEGEATVGGAMVVTADKGWNRLVAIDRPWTAWTHDGSVIDQLRFWAGMPDGAAIGPTDNREQRPLTFKRTMEPHELAALFASLQARDGSAVTLEKLEPAPFVGVQGVRFRFSVLRSSDDMRLSGVGWAAVRDEQLYAMTFVAPRLDFFARHEAEVERIAQSARAKSVMKTATFNVNGINGRLPRLLEWLAESQLDVACLQEVKTGDASFPVESIVVSRQSGGAG